MSKLNLADRLITIDMLIDKNKKREHSPYYTDWIILLLLLLLLLYTIILSSTLCNACLENYVRQLYNYQYYYY